MNAITTVFALLAALFLSLCANAQAPAAGTFAATYTLEYKGSRVGESVISLRPEGSDYVYQSRTEPRGLARLVRGGTLTERSRFRIDGVRLVPVEFEFDDGTRKGKDNNRVLFDTDSGSASSSYRGEDHAFAIEPGMLDRLLFQYAMMRDLRQDALAERYSIVDRDKVKVYEIARIGEERIETPVGAYDTIAVRRQREGSSRATILWFAPALDWLPVRLRQLKEEKTLTEMTLKTVAGLPAGD